MTPRPLTEHELVVLRATLERAGKVQLEAEVLERLKDQSNRLPFGCLNRAEAPHTDRSRTSSEAVLLRAGCACATSQLICAPRDFDRHSALVMHLRRSTIVVLVVLGLVSGGCRSRAPVRGTTLQLGRALNPDQTVSGHTTRFKPLDTIYASVVTAGSGRATIVARWTYAGQVVSEPTKEITYKGEAATEFHIRNNAGFPPGDYSVEILVNGESVGRRAFRVEK